MHPNWKALATVHFPWKRFVREGSPTNEENNKTKILTNPSLTGAEAKRIYEEVVNSDPTFRNKIICGVPKKCKISHAFEGTSYIRERSKWINILMAGAQRNDVACVSSLLVDGSDVNAVDQYGWTALMSAACAGAVDVAKLLIGRGADVNVKDKCGNTCLSLAHRQRHKNVLDIILKPHSNLLHEEPESKPDVFYCEVCKQQFSDSQHTTSTVHLLCSKPKVKVPTVYGIPATNKGYQILLKGGWDRERGLGPEGSGHKFPLKTVLKRDREGFGGERKRKARVTHSVERERNIRTIGRHARAAALNKERRKERALRLELS